MRTTADPVLASLELRGSQSARTRLALLRREAACAAHQNEVLMQQWSGCQGPARARHSAARPPRARPRRACCGAAAGAAGLWGTLLQRRSRHRR